MKIAVITSGFLTLPAVEGGAVEVLLNNFLDLHENSLNNENFVVFANYNNDAFIKSRGYKKSEFIYIKENKILKFFDKFIYFISDKILKKNNSTSYKHILKRLNYINKVSIYLKKNNYDKILIENHPLLYWSLKLRKNYIKYTGKYIYHSHNEIKNFFGIKKIASNTSNVVCVSEFISGKMKESYGNHISTDVVYNAIDNTKFDKEVDLSKLYKKFNFEANDFIITFAGRIVEEKGIYELILAIKEINDPSIKLIIVGGNLEEKNKITNFEKKIIDAVSSIKKQVFFTGYIDNTEIYKYYKLANIVAIPSIWDDPCPLTILEAQASKSLIISTFSGGIPEIINEKASILISKNINTIINDLSVEIVKLKKNPNIQKKMKENIIQREEIFILEKNYNELHNLYTKI